MLTGSWSFNGGISTYGSFSVYPPLFQFWQDIVNNNPYKYASALAGNGSWMDPTHWIQDMDPNYGILVGGALVNSLPNTAQGGADGAVDAFGTVCFLEADCHDVRRPGDADRQRPLYRPARRPRHAQLRPEQCRAGQQRHARRHRQGALL